MINTHLIRIVALALMVVCAGCGAPVVEITHNYQADLSVPPETKCVSVGQFTVDGWSAGDFDAVAAKSILNELNGMEYVAMPYAPSSQPASAPSIANNTLYIAGKIFVAVKDDQGTRKIRLAPVGAFLKEVPTLVRNVEVRIVFQLTVSPDGKSVGTAETVQKYSSMQDPAVRGDDGLLRPDDPRNVPPVDVIVRRLIPGCTKPLVSMIQPVSQTTRVALRPASNYIGREALSLARRKKYDQALVPARIAVGMDNSDAMIFNLAVLNEVTGDYDDALRYYRNAWEISNGRDFPARDGIRRIERLAAMYGISTSMPASAPIVDPTIVSEPPAFMQSNAPPTDVTPSIAPPTSAEKPATVDDPIPAEVSTPAELPNLKNGDQPGRSDPVDPPPTSASPKDTGTSKPSTEPAGDLPSLLSPE